MRYLPLAAVLVASAVGEARGQTTASQSDSGLFLAAAFTRLSDADFRDFDAGVLSVTEDQFHAGGLRFSIGDVALDAGIDYQYTRYEYEGLSGRDRDLHRLQFPVEFSMPLERWRLKGYVAPGVSTSSNVFKDFFNRGTRDDLFANARVAGYREADARTWIVGLAYDRLFGEATLYPVLGVELTPRPALDIRLAFPDPAFRYRVSGRVTLHGRLFPAGHEWHVVSDDFTSEFDYRVEAYRAQAGLSFRILEALNVDLSLGYEFAREHEFTDDTGTRISSRIDDQWLAAIGFRLGPAGIPYTHGGHL